MSGKMRYSLQTQTWPRRAARAGGSSAGTGGARRGAKTAGATPTTGCVTPQVVWESSDAEKFP